MNVQFQDLATPGSIEEKCKNIARQNDIKMKVEDGEKQVKKTNNWKSSGPDGVHGYWIKNFPNLHERTLEKLDISLENGVVPEWMTKGRTSQVLKDRSKRGLIANYRPITCLPLMWRPLTGIIGESVYNHLEKKQILLPEQKGGRRGCRGTKDQLMIDKMSSRIAED